MPQRAITRWKHRSKSHWVRKCNNARSVGCAAERESDAEPAEIQTVCEDVQDCHIFRGEMERSGFRSYF